MKNDAHHASDTHSSGPPFLDEESGCADSAVLGTVDLHVREPFKRPRTADLHLNRKVSHWSNPVVVNEVVVDCCNASDVQNKKTR